MRRPSTKKINIYAEHAFVKQLTRKDKIWTFNRKMRQSIVRRTSKTENNPYYSIAMSLAHLLYPKNFPAQIASKYEGPKKKFRTTYSGKVTLTEKTQDGIESFYQEGIPWLNETRDAHFSAINGPATQRAYEIWFQSGIKVNKKPMNVGLTPKNKVIFFEVSTINLPRLECFIRSMPSSTPAQKMRRKKALSLFEELFKNQLTEEINVHTPKG